MYDYLLFWLINNCLGPTLFLSVKDYFIKDLLNNNKPLTMDSNKNKNIHLFRERERLPTTVTDVE